MMALATMSRSQKKNTLAQSHPLMVVDLLTTKIPIIMPVRMKIKV